MRNTVSEKRVVLLTALTLGMYSMSLYVEHQALIFPFPLNESLFFLVALYFFYRNHATHRTIGILAISTGFFALLSNQFFWSFLLDGAQIERLFNSGLTDFFRLMFFILLLCWAIVTANSDEGASKFWYKVGIVLCLFVGLYFQMSLVLFSVYLLFSCHFFWRNLHPPYPWLWLLLAILEAGKATMQF
jgi:hypothetical protein